MFNERGPPRFFVFGLVACLAISAMTNTAAAQPDRDEVAREAFLAGREAFEAGDFETALDAFERSYASSGRPQILNNIAAAHDRLGHHEQAVAFYRHYLEASPEDAPNRSFVESRIAVLEVLIDEPVEEAEGEEEGPAPTTEASASESPSLVPPVALMAGGAALGVVSVGLLLRGQNQLDDIEAECTAGCSVDTVIEDSGVERTRTLVRVTGILGGAAALGGALWLLLQPRSEDDYDPSAPQLSAGLGFGTVHVQGRF